VSWTGVRERLAELAAADPGFERFGAREHEYWLGPPIPEADLVEFETRHGVTLPEDYRDFLLTAGENGAGPHYGLYLLSAPECPYEDEWRPGFAQTVPPRLRDVRPARRDRAGAGAAVVRRPRLRLRHLARRHGFS